MENEKTTNKKKQKMQPSSSRRESSPDYRRPRKQAIGCMSGILHLLSRRNSRRRISSPVRNEGVGAIPKTTTTSLPAPPQLKSDSVPNGEAKSSVGDDGLTWRSTCQAPRSPMLSSEIRRSGGCFDRAGDSPRRSSALVAKLMGLEEPPIASPVLIGSSPESAEEKRRKLLGALERCDEDLRALKRVIDAVRTAEILRLKAGGDLEDGEPMTGVTKCPDSYGEQPSPVSVLDAVAFSSPKPRASANGEVPKKACNSVGSTSPVYHRIKMEGLPRQKIMNDFRPAATAILDGCWRWRRSRATVESVGKVWEDAAIEERKEVVGVGVALVDQVAGDLLEELVIELMESCSTLQRGRYKRKLINV